MMSQKQIKSNQNIYRTLSKMMFLPVSIAILATSSSANAIPVVKNYAGQILQRENSSNWGKFFQLITQNSTQPPDVIIDPDSGSNTSTTTTIPGSGSTTTTTTTTSTGDRPRFTCETANGEYTVMYHPSGDLSRSYAWAVPGNMGGGWSSQRRCVEISRRLESYRPDGLVDLTTGVENNYNVVCVTTESNPNCRIVFTVPPGKDPQLTRDLVFDNLSIADSGQQTQGVVTFGEGNNGNILDRIGDVLNGGHRSSKSPKNINLRPFLDKNDGGTGAKLRRLRVK